MSYAPTSQRDLSDMSPEELEAAIAETRARLSRNVDDLSFKLSPEGLSHDAKSTLGGTQELTFGAIEEMGERLSARSDGWGEQTAAFIKRNPVPSTLLGLGLTWLVMRASSRR